jgi:hypothetical protein
VLHVASSKSPVPSTFIVYVVVVVGVIDVDQFHVGEVNAAKPLIVGENVALAPLVYHAVIVTDSPDSILAVFVVSVQVAPPVLTAGPSNPLQSTLQ